MTIDPNDYDLDETVRLFTTKDVPDRPIQNTLRKVVVHAVDSMMKDPMRWGHISIAYRDQILSEGQIEVLYKHVKDKAA